MPIPNKKPKAIIFDVDKTLTESVTWYELTSQLGANPREHAQIYTQMMLGKISYPTAKKTLLQLWLKNGRVTKTQLETIFNKIYLRGEAHATLAELQERGYELCLISSSIDLFIQTVAKRFNIQHYYANAQLIFNDQEELIDFDYQPKQSELKLQQFQDFLKKTGLSNEDCLVVGDDDNDSLLFQTIPGIALHSPSDHLNQLAWQKIKYLPRIIQIIESIE